MPIPSTVTAQTMRSLDNAPDCGTAYERVAYADGVYTPKYPHFKAVFAHADGNITIRGFDGVAETFPVLAGLHALGGVAIVEATTNITVTAIF